MPDTPSTHSTQELVRQVERAFVHGIKPENDAAREALDGLVEQYEVARESSAAMGRALAAAHTKLTEYEEQLEAFQELAQDASDITQVGHGLELDVPVNLGSVKWVESAHHVLLTMASLASNPAISPKDVD